MTTAAPRVITGPPSAIPDPVIERKGDDWWALWPDYLVRMRFSRVHERGEALRAELTVYVDIPDAPVPAEWTNISDLASSDIRARLASRLRQQWEGPGAPPYQEMLLAASYTVAEQFGAGEPVTEIGDPRKPIRSQRYLLWPLLAENQLNILYADGASLKSLLAMAVGMSVQEGRDLLAGTRLNERTALSRKGRTLYLDKETTEDEQHARLVRLAKGFGIDLKQPMLYRESHVPLRRDAHALRSIVDEHDVALVIVDSMGPALGGDPNDAETVTAAMDILRSLRTTVLIIDHVTKLDDQGKPIGSAYKWDLSRSAWHAKRVQETDSDVVNVALVHSKANNGRLLSPLGYAVRFSETEDGPITIKHLDIRDHADLAQLAKAPARITHALRHGPLDASALAEAVGEMKAETFRKTLKRLRERGEIIVMQGGLYALSAEARR